MRMVAALAALLVGGTASAQPGAPPPPPAAPPPPHQYQPGYAYPVALSAEEHELLLQGEISSGAHFGGGVAAFFVGFGLGQAVQGRWADTGWIFTLGDAAAVTVFTVGLVRTFEDCTDDFGNEEDCGSNGPTLMVVGLLGGLAIRTWEIVDAISGPNDHNRRVRDLKYRMGIPVQVGVEPYVTRTRDGGATAGLTLRF